MVVVASAWAGSLLAQPSAPCAVDDDDIPWQVPDCALIERQGEQYLAAKYLTSRRLEFNAYDLAWFHLHSGGYVYINRTGRIVISDVAIMDNGAEAFHHGLVRLERGGRYGFADRNGRIVVPIRYGGASNSDDEGPRVCVGCRLERKGEYGFFTKGQWFSVDAGGRLHKLSRRSDERGAIRQRGYGSESRPPGD